MPYCPQCRCEYLPEIVTCCDCEAPLVAELPRAALRPDRGLVAVYSGPFLEVGMLREALHGRGIATLQRVTDPDTGFSGRFLTTPRFAQLLVARADAEARRAEIEACLDFVTPGTDPVPLGATELATAVEPVAAHGPLGSAVRPAVGAFALGFLVMLVSPVAGTAAAYLQALAMGLLLLGGVCALMAQATRPR
jgi:hypothetical protein